MHLKSFFRKAPEINIMVGVRFKFLIFENDPVRSLGKTFHGDRLLAFI